MLTSLQESKKDHSMHTASQRTLEYGQVVLSTDNIFSRCRQRSAIQQQPQVQHPQQQLDIIANFVSDLLAICKRSPQGGPAPAAAVASAAAAAAAAPMAAALSAAGGAPAASSTAGSAAGAAG